MLTVIIVTILICSAMSDWASGKDWEQSERNAERRHQELLDAIERGPVRLNKKPEPFNKITRRRAIKDKSGRVLVEEVIISGNYDEEDSEEEDWY